MTEEIKEARTCAFTNCVSLLNSYNKSKYCYSHQKHENEFIHGITKEEKKIIEEQPRNRQILYLYNEVKSPYFVEFKDKGGELATIVQKGKDITTKIWLRNHPDLFIEFFELPEENDAYLAFISKYGFLGLYEHYSVRDKFWLSYVEAACQNPTNCPCQDPKYSHIKHWSEWEKNEELVTRIRSFHRDFKENYNRVQNVLNSKNIPSLEKDRFIMWIRYWFKTSMIGYWPDFDRTTMRPTDSFKLTHTTLAGALILQLYSLLRLGKTPKECELPGCNIQTIRRRFCSDKHANLYRAWKRRKKLD